MWATLWCTVKAEGDSLRVVNLLQRGGALEPSANLMLWYGKEFVGTPYKAQALEINPKESLVVNLREMDCTTFVETVAALTLTTREKSASYDAFRKNLQRIRYRLGQLDGYASRNHYFQWWIESNSEMGLVKEIMPSTGARTMTLHLHHMSRHIGSYPMLKDDPLAQRLIAAHERESSGKKVRYLPKSEVGKDSKTLGFIESGDILVITTSKDGLDCSHIGIAVWGRDGKLHLLNASQIHKKVVVEPMTLFAYMQRHPTQTGIRIVRLLANQSLH